MDETHTSRGAGASSWRLSTRFALAGAEHDRQGAFIGTGGTISSIGSLGILDTMTNDAIRPADGIFDKVPELREVATIVVTPYRKLPSPVGRDAVRRPRLSRTAQSGTEGRLEPKELT